MWLTERLCFVPRCWMHNYDIKNKEGKTLKDLMMNNKMPVPEHWNNIKEMSIFDQAYFGIIPDISGHSPNE